MLLVKLALRLFNVFGCTLSLSSRRGNLTFVPSYYVVFYNLVLIGLQLPVNYFAVRYLYANDFSNDSRFDIAVDVIRMNCNMLVASFILLVYCAKRKQLARLASKICRTRELVSYYDAAAGGTIRSNIVKRVFLTNGLSFLAMCVTSNVDDGYDLIYYLLNYWCDLVILCASLQYCLIVRLVEHMLRVLNGALVSSATKVAVSVISRDDDESSSGTMAKLSRLQELHSTLFDVADELSEVYSYPLLMAVCFAFLQMTLYAYFFVKTCIGSEDELTAYFLIYSSLAIIYHTVSLAVLTRAVGSAVAESKRTGKAVHCCIRSCGDQLVVRQLNQFSNYLLHQDLRFTAAGLFSLDGTLLMSIVGSITTYMMILMQFQKDDP